MPIPKPKDGEKQKDFADRCMSDDVMVKEYPENDQRLAICMQAWRDKDKDKSGMNPDMIERRYFDAAIEIRAADEGKPKELIGYASVFNSRASWGGFEEMVAPGAFKGSIVADDIRALWNHDPNYILGRNKANTLELWEDDHGLGVKIKPPDTQWARDLMTSIGRRDVTQMSIGFEVKKQTIKYADEANDPDLRTIQEVKLWDVSPVTFPFYTDTSVALRAIEAGRTVEKIVSSVLGLKRLRLRKRKLDDYLKGR